MAEKDPHVIGARIARRRHQLDWSQVELARRLKVSPSTVANWERGASYPRKKLGKVEQVLGIVLDGEPEPAPVIPESLLQAIMETEGLSDEDRVSVIAAIDKMLTKEHGAAARSEPGAAAARHRPAS